MEYLTKKRKIHDKNIAKELYKFTGGNILELMAAADKVHAGQSVDGKNLVLRFCI